jgi:spermidine synthase
VAKSLEEVGFRTVVGLLATYGGRAADLRPWLEGAEINRDRNLRLQYLAGMGLNLQHSDYIHGEMMLYRRFPEDLFLGDSWRYRLLRRSFTLPTTSSRR